MLKINIIRSKNNVTTISAKKIESDIAETIAMGIKSCPLNETQNINIKIKDRPVLRQLANALELGEDLVKAKVQTVFIRSGLKKDKQSVKKFVFEDTFSSEQLSLFEKEHKGLRHKDSFLKKLVDNINKSITE